MNDEFLPDELAAPAVAESTRPTRATSQMSPALQAVLGFAREATIGTLESAKRLTRDAGNTLHAAAGGTRLPATESDLFDVLAMVPGAGAAGKTGSRLEDVITRLAGTSRSPAGRGYRHRETVSFYEPEPGVVRQLQAINSRYEGVPPSPVDFTRYRNVPWSDTDFPSGVDHADEQITAQNVGEMIEHLRRYQAAQRMRGHEVAGELYLTPGGARYVEKSRQATPEQFFGEEVNNHWMGTDPAYAKVAQKPVGVLQRDSRLGEDELRLAARMLPSFSLRTSAKPGREGDFVAAPFARFGQGQRLEESERLVKLYHDDVIQRHLQRGDMQAIGERINETFARQLESLTPEDRDRVVKGLSLSLVFGVGAAAQTDE